MLHHLCCAVICRAVLRCSVLRYAALQRCDVRLFATLLLRYVPCHLLLLSAI
jgi:hypothetical protein